MLVEVISNYTREASNTVKFKIFKVKVSHFLIKTSTCIWDEKDDCFVDLLISAESKE